MLALTACAAGCASGQAGDFCDVAKAHYLDKQASVDYLAKHEPEFATGVVQHNEWGEERCGWKVPG